MTLSLHHIRSIRWMIGSDLKFRMNRLKKVVQNRTSESSYSFPFVSMLTENWNKCEMLVRNWYEAATKQTNVLFVSILIVLMMMMTMMLTTTTMDNMKTRMHNARCWRRNKNLKKTYANSMWIRINLYAHKTHVFHFGNNLTYSKNCHNKKMWSNGNHRQYIRIVRVQIEFKIRCCLCLWLLIFFSWVVSLHISLFSVQNSFHFGVSESSRKMIVVLQVFQLSEALQHYNYYCANRRNDIRTLERV